MPRKRIKNLFASMMLVHSFLWWTVALYQDRQTRRAYRRSKGSPSSEMYESISPRSSKGIVGLKFEGRKVTSRAFLCPISNPVRPADWCQVPDTNRRPYEGTNLCYGCLLCLQLTVHKNRSRAGVKENKAVRFGSRYKHAINT